MSYLILIICWIDRAFTTLIFLPHAVYPVPEVPPHQALDAPHHAAVPGLQGSGDPVSGAYLLRRIHLHTSQL